MTLGDEEIKEVTHCKGRFEHIRPVLFPPSNFSVSTVRNLNSKIAASRSEPGSNQRRELEAVDAIDSLGIPLFRMLYTDDSFTLYPVSRPCFAFPDTTKKKNQHICPLEYLQILHENPTIQVVLTTHQVHPSASQHTSHLGPPLHQINH